MNERVVIIMNTSEHYMFGRRSGYIDGKFLEDPEVIAMHWARKVFSIPLMVLKTALILQPV